MSFFACLRYFCSTRYKLFIGCIIVASFAFRYIVPSNVLLGTSYDDWLGIHLANNLQQWKWLGDWEIRTLMKGPGYSLFIAPLKTFGINPVFAIHGIYLVALWLLINSFLNLFRPSSMSAFLKVVTFSVGSLNPVIFSADFSRLYRTSLYPCLVLISIALYAQFFSTFDRERKHSRKKLLILVFLGLCLGFSTITRPEAKWQVYFMVVLFSIHSVRFIMNESEISINFRKAVSRGLLMLLILSLAIMSPSLIVKSINKNVYGVSTVENYFSGPFSDVIGTLSSIEPRNDARMYVPISQTQLDRAYQASPIFATLKPFLEYADTWEKETSCAQGVACDTSASWITFEIRDAAMSQEQFLNEKEFQDFFSSIDKELKDSCKNQSLNCGSSGLATGLVPLKYFDWDRVISLLIQSSRVLTDYSFSPQKQPQPTVLIEKIWPEWENTITPLREDSLPSSTPEAISAVLKILNYIFVLVSVILLFSFLFKLKSIKNRLMQFAAHQRTNIFFLHVLVFGLLIMNLITSAIGDSSFGFTQPTTVYLITGSFCYLAIQLLLVCSMLPSIDDSD